MMTRECRGRCSCFVCQDGTADPGFEGLTRGNVEENRRKSGVFCFESGYPKRITRALFFKSVIVLLLHPKSVTIMAVLTHFFAQRLQCCRSIFAAAATACHQSRTPRGV